MGKIREDVPDLAQPRPALDTGIILHVLLDFWEFRLSAGLAFGMQILSWPLGDDRG